MKTPQLLAFLLLIHGAVAQVVNPTAAAITTTIKALYTNNAPLDVTTFNNANSYQSKALADTIKALAASGAGALRQREFFALACIFRATNAVANPRSDNVVPAKWTNTTNWTTNPNYCTWSGIICKNSNNLVTEIVLYNNALSGEMPDEVILLGATLDNLDLAENFYLWKGNFTWMPKMTVLQYLYFGGTSFDSDGIPTQLSSIKTLGTFTLCSTHPMWFFLVLATIITKGFTFTFVTQCQTLNVPS